MPVLGPSRDSDIVMLSSLATYARIILSTVGQLAIELKGSIDGMQVNEDGSIGSNYVMFLFAMDLGTAGVILAVISMIKRK
ncbi:MAG: hypothetical protein WAO91_05795 [Candidatus Nitrosotenuis sp.]